MALGLVPLLLLAMGGSPSATPAGSQSLLPGKPSAEAGLEYLRRVMDEYHSRFPVYDDVSSGGNHFFAWSKVPDENAAVDINGSWADNPHSGATAIRAEFHNVSGRNFGGFYFLNGLLPSGATAPIPNFGEVGEAGVDLSGATTLTFWARGQRGGERVSFFLGGVGRDTNTGQPVTSFPDSTPVIKQTVVLTTQWRKYSFDLRGRDLHYVLGGFGWVASAVDNPAGVIFFLDDISYDLAGSALDFRLGQPRFLRSFTTAPYQALPDPIGIFDLANRQVASTYDNAVALLAFLADGSMDSLRRARLIGEAFVYAAAHDRYYSDGRLRDAYRSGDLIVPPGWTPNGKVGTVAIPGYYDEAQKKTLEVAQSGLSTGNEAWAMLALLSLYQRTADTRYLETVKGLAHFVLTVRKDGGTFQGFQGGLDHPESSSPVRRPWASTEHNLDLFAAFSQLARVDSTGDWTDQADHARRFVEAMWDESHGCNLAGTTDPETRNSTAGQLPVDAQAWAVLAMPDILAVHPGLLACAEHNHLTSEVGFRGFDFNEDRDGIWFEGTADMVAAYRLAGRPADAYVFATMLARAQGDPAFGDGFGIAAATKDGLTTGFDNTRYYRRLSVGSTAWSVFAQLAFNPFVASPTLCTAGDTTLCLSSGRFEITVDWQLPSGTGKGHSVVLTADSGYFWFFNNSNVELIVKILDGCAVNGQYWIFAGGLTNVLATLTARDTATGAVRTYTNPQGTAFQPIQDTSAFPTCP